MGCRCKWYPCGFDALRTGLLTVVFRWNPSGVLIGKFVVNGGVNNFAFVPNGMYIFNADKLFKVTIKAEGRTVARDFGLAGQRDGNSNGAEDHGRHHSGRWGPPS